MSDWVLSRPVAVADIHGATDVDVTATDEERAALAAKYDLLEVVRLYATVRLSGNLGAAIDVAGRVTADIVQACVVTLEPVRQHIDEPLDARLVRLGSTELAAAAAKPHAEIVVDPAAPDPPEVLAGPTFDLGALVEETFVLAIDPYPRAEGAVLPEVGKREPGESPFAVLAGLKRGKQP
jgi:uncharacterized metal-binding protein YceD (DUF177 family)